MAHTLDYMNINFTSLEDLDTIDSKISQLEVQKSQIGKAVDQRLLNRNATPQPQDIDEETAGYVGGIVSSINELLDDRGSLTEVKIERIDGLIEQHGELQVLKDLKVLFEEKKTEELTVGLLEKARGLESAIKSLDANQQDDFEKINQDIKELKANQLSSDYDEIIEQLSLDFLNKVDERRLKLADDLNKLLTKVHWLAPKSKSQSIPNRDLKEITSSFQKLLDLQIIVGKPTYPDSWWALEVLLQPFIIRFNYHFDNKNKETNKLSKPEWAFNFFEEFLIEDISYIELILGGMLEKYGRVSTYEIITTTLKPVRDKISKMVGILNDNISKCQDQTDIFEKSGRLLAHLIFELSSFDQRLRNQYKYNPYIDGFDEAPSKKWLGLTGDILIHDKNEKEAVTNWLNFEYDLAKKRFDSEIIGLRDAFDIDFDHHGDESNTSKHSLKPTYSSYNLVKLFNNLTSHYKTLSIVKFQLRYVSRIQIKLIDLYFEHIIKEFRKFSDTFNSNKVLNFIPGGLKESDKTGNTDVLTNGLNGLKILTGLFCSLRFIRDSFDEWSEELIFVQLWDSYAKISHDEVGKTLFDFPIEENDHLINKQIQQYEEFFRREIKNSLKSYVNSTQWNIPDSTTSAEPSGQLSTLITNIPNYMNFLRKSVSDVDYYQISNKIVSILCTILHEYIVTNNQFSKMGSEQLKTDFQFISDKFRDDLLLYETNETIYTNRSHKSYMRLKESIDFLQNIDPSVAKSLRQNMNKVPQLRSQFDHYLQHLNDHEINDLIYRIV